MAETKTDLSAAIDTAIVAGATTEDLRDILKLMVGSYTDFIISVTTAQRDLMTPSANAIIYNSDNNRLEYYVNGYWQSYNEDPDGTYLYTASSSIATGKRIILVDSTAGSVTMSLPDAASCDGRRYTFIKLVSANSMILDGYSSQTINGSTTQTYTTQWSKVTLLAYNSNWIIIA